MTNHHSFTELLARRAELTPADERRLRLHLEGCAECRATAAAYEHQWTLLKTMPMLETPPMLRASVLSRIHASAPAALPWYARWNTLLAPTVAAAVLVLLGVAWLAGTHVLIPGDRHNAASARLPAPTGAPTRSTINSPAIPNNTASPGGGKQAVAVQHSHSPVAPRSGRVPGRSVTATSGTARLVPTRVSGGPALITTAVPFGGNQSIAARALPTSSSAGTRPRGAVRSARTGVRLRPGTTGVTPRPLPTAVPTAAPVGIAVGPPSNSSPAPHPPALAPIRKTATPAAGVPAGTPIVVVTPVVAATPLPIIPSTATPSPAAAVVSVPATLTPTPTSTPHH